MSRLQGNNSSHSTGASLRSFMLPGVVVFVQLLWIIAIPLATPGAAFQHPFFVYGFIPSLSTLILLVWFLLRKGKASTYRLFVCVVFVVAFLTQASLLHPSLRLTRVFIFQPVITSLLTLTIVALRNQKGSIQLGGVVAMLCMMLGITCSLRMDGMSGAMVPQFAWRWSTHADESLSHPSVKENAIVALPESSSPFDWPAFRGPQRDGVVRDVQLETDWEQFPPQELWRVSVGPGWSSFSVVDDYAFTQEQQETDEVISCRSVTTGELLWTRAVPGRFEDTSSGPGPRSTPSYSEGRLFALTATGSLLALDATTGELFWKQDLTEIFNVEVPHWGFACSPLIYDHQVIVFTGSSEGKSVASFDDTSGELLWSNGNGHYSYSSPHLVRLHDVPQILMATEHGLDSYSPEDGNLLWSHEWEIGFSARIVQPCHLPGDDLLLATGYGKGTRRLHVEHHKSVEHEPQWSIEPVWTSRRLKPYFNDLVVSDGYVYGFDGNILTCMDANDGERGWRQRGFGYGQLLLLEAQNLLLILSEEGKVSLVAASVDGFQQLAEFPALEGKTWNHPVMTGSHLLVRNGTQAACYQLKMVDNNDRNRARGDVR